MARFTDVFTESNAPKENKPVTKKIKNIHYTKLVQSEYQYRERTSKVVDSLADLIKADGKVLEPLVVRKSGPGSDTYEIISGHKRCLACKCLVEKENMEQFAFIPCIEENMSDVRAEFAVYSTNGYDEKTPYEIMREIEGMARLLKEYPEEFPEFAGKGRLVEKLAAKMNMSRSVVSDYQNIAHNLGDAGMESFKEGTLDKSAAVTLASMPEEQQEEVLNQGITRREEIKSYIQKQVKEPSKKEIIQFYNKYCKVDIRDKNPSFWTGILKTRYGKCYSGGGNSLFDYDCTPRGIRINTSDEITWSRYVKLLMLYLPESAYAGTGENITSEEQLKTYAPEYVQQEEQIPGQDSVTNHPEWMPEEQNIVTDENVPTVGTKEQDEDEEKQSWYQVKLPDVLVAKVCDEAVAEDTTMSEIISFIVQCYFDKKENSNE